MAVDEASFSDPGWHCTKVSASLAAMQFSHSFMQQLHAVLLCVVSFREDCQARKLNKEDAMDRSKCRKLIKDVRCSGWV